jgi:hypothetical protein
VPSLTFNVSITPVDAERICVVLFVVDLFSFGRREIPETTSRTLAP